MAKTPPPPPPRAFSLTELVLVALVVAALMTLGWWLFLRPDPSLPVGVATEAPPSKEERAAGPKVSITPKKPIKVSPSSVKAPLGLPPTVIADTTQHVTATAKVPEDGHSHTVSAVYREGDGATTIYVRKDPLPAFALTDESAIGIGYGIREDGAQVGVLYGKVSVVQMKSFRAGARAVIDTQGRTLIWLGGEWAL